MINMLQRGIVLRRISSMKAAQRCCLAQNASRGFAGKGIKDVPEPLTVAALHEMGFENYRQSKPIDYAAFVDTEEFLTYEEQINA